MSPEAEIYPSESEGPYVLVVTVSLPMQWSKPYLSNRLRKAMVDEAEKGAHPNQRINVAY